MSDENLSCSFCGKQQHEVKKLIAGQNVYICDDCVSLCSGILKQEETDKARAASPTNTTGPIPSPREIKDYLDQYVVGQEEAKVTVSVAVSNHYKRISVMDDGDEVELEKSNCLLIGNSGVGKTVIGQTIARMLDVPFVIVDSTTLTEAGYIGDDAETIVSRLVQQAGFDIRKAERGIIFVDEIDKKAQRASASGGRDVSGEGVQQALLKIIEGTEVRIPSNGGKKSMGQDTITVNTRNILFIFGGAFVGLDKIINKRRSGGGPKIGFNTAPVEKVDLHGVEAGDLVQFGLIPELVGRIPVIATLKDLTEEQLVEIMTTPRNAITKQYRKLFSLDGVELSFADDALREIARQASRKKTGARGLRSILEEKLIPVQFLLHDWKKEGCTGVVVDLPFLTGGDINKNFG